MSQELIKQVREYSSKATPGPGGFYQLTIPITENKEEVLANVRKSIEASIVFDGGHPWVQVVADNPERVVADFGCGPTSLANAEFWARSRSDILLLCDALSLVTKQRDELVEILEVAKIEIESRSHRSGCCVACGGEQVTEKDDVPCKFHRMYKSALALIEQRKGK